MVAINYWNEYKNKMPVAWCHKCENRFLVKGNLPNTAKVIPSNINKNKIWSMFGGNFVYSSDSRFNEAVVKLTGSSGPVAVHDRIEVA